MMTRKKVVYRAPVRHEKLIRLKRIVRVSWTIYCQQCGEAVRTERRTRRYCSDACKAKAYRQRVKDRAHLAKIQASERLFDPPDDWNPMADIRRQRKVENADLPDDDPEWRKLQRLWLNGGMA
jgi:endogenous inhibitor of DNA gyrase (YacG/DUF329 family)